MDSRKTCLKASHISCEQRHPYDRSVGSNNIKQNIAIHQDDVHVRGPRVSTMISSVVIRPLPLPRSWATIERPRPCRVQAFVMRTASPSTSQVTSVWGSSPNCSRISMGMVIWPFDVIRILPPGKNYFILPKKENNQGSSVTVRNEREHNDEFPGDLP